MAQDMSKDAAKPSAQEAVDFETWISDCVEAPGDDAIVPMDPPNTLKDGVFVDEVGPGFAAAPALAVLLSCFVTSQPTIGVPDRSWTYRCTSYFTSMPTSTPSTTKSVG